MKKRLLAVFALLSFSAIAQAAAPCVDGQADGYACSHVNLLARLSIAELGGAPGERLNDIWGWTDANGTEYAIVGMSDGTAFVRLPDTGAPELLGRLQGSDGVSPIPKHSSKNEHGVEKMCRHDDGCGEASAWRDVKVYENHAFIVSEAAGFGMQVFDLAQLQNASAGGAGWNRGDAVHYAGVGHAHNIFINEDSGRAYIVGAGDPGSETDGGLHVIDVRDPQQPRHLGDIDTDGYTHDVQCVIYAGPDTRFTGNELCFASNEDSVTIWNLRDFPAEPAEMLARFTYPDAGYVHQGWLSDDQRYFFFNDELDEVNSGSRTHLRVLDVADVTAPRIAADYFAPTLAIDHNNYVHGRWLLQSNYAAGLRILDVQSPEHPVEAAYFDTVANDATDFTGVWSNYLFQSGRVVLSDIHGGLFVVQPALSIAGIAPDLTVTLELDKPSAGIDEIAAATVVVENGNAAEASDVLLTVHLPAAAEFETVPASSAWQWTTDGRVAQARVAQLAAGATEEFRLTFVADAAGPVDVIAMAYAAEADAAATDNLASRRVTVNAPAGVIPGSGGGSGAILWLLGLLLAPVLGKVRER